MDPRRAKQILYGGGFCLIALAILFGIYWLWIRPAPPPPCQQCDLQAKLTPPSVDWTRFWGGDGQTIIVAEIKNPNNAYGASILSYSFTAYGASSRALASLPGSAFIYPAQVKYIFALAALDAKNITSVSTTLTVGRWDAIDKWSAPALQIRGVMTTSSAAGPVAVLGALDNQGASALRSARVVAFLFNKDGDMISASKTDLDSLASFGSQQFTILFPKSVHLPAPSPAPAFTYTFTRDLTSGSKGDDVRALQKFLASQGFWNGSTTGTFGPATKRALAAFQKKFNITPANGVFNSRTSDYVNSLTKPQTQPAPDPLTVDPTLTKVYADGYK